MPPIMHQPTAQYDLTMLYDREVLPQHRVHRHYSDVSYLNWYIRKGVLRLETTTQTFEASAGDWIFIDPLTMKSHYFSDDTVLISISFRINLHGLHFLPPLQAPRIHRDNTHSDLLRASESLSDFELNYPRQTQVWPPSIECQRSARFFNWLTQWHSLRESNTTSNVVMDPRIYTILATLETHASPREVDYTQLGKAVGLSRAQINRIFKVSTGLTPLQWRDAQCLRKAEDWIRANELSIKEIAHKLDFFDASHFTKWFRSKMGVTPSTWKEL